MLPNIFERRSNTFRVSYKFYSRCLFSLAIFVFLTELYKLYQIITDDPFIFDEAIRNYIITAYHFTTLIRCYLLKGKVSEKIFKNVIKYERKILESRNADVISVYNQIVASVRNTTVWYFVGIILVVITYIPAPLYRDPYSIVKGNETLEVKQMPLSSWTPFDDSYSYWLAFVWTSSAGAYLSAYFVTSDLTCFSFILFGTCQIMILKHFIQNFKRYSKVIEEQQGLNRNESVRILQRECIIMQQEVIRYVGELNTKLKSIMLLDFLPSSLQLAGLIYQIVTNLSISQVVLLGLMTCTFIARIFIYCKSANDLAEQSLSIASDWYNMDWSELPSDVRKNLIVCIRRSQYPVKLTIGDYEDITLATFVMILKGTYTYIMVLTTVTV